MRKNLDPNLKLERQHANPIKGSVVKLHIGQGRAGLKRKRSDPINQTINQLSELSQKIPGKTEIETGKSNQAHSKDPMHIIKIGEAPIENVITKYCIPESIIMDQDSAFMSSLMMYLLNKFNIKMKTVAPYSHQSLQAEHIIKSLSTILTKHLTNLGQMWPKYLPLAMFAYNTFNTPNLGNFSPYELTYGRKPRPLLNLDSNPDIKISGTFRAYYELLNKTLKYLHDILLNFKSKRLAMINEDRTFF